MLSYFHFACAGPIPFITFDKHGGSDRKTDEWTADQIAYDEYLQQEIAHQGWYYPITPPTKLEVSDTSGLTWEHFRS